MPSTNTPSSSGHDTVLSISAQLASVPALFQSALAALQAGRMAEAETGLRQLLAIDNRHAEALHILGILSHQKGDSDLAIMLIRQALTVREDVSFVANLGNIFKEHNRLNDAELAYRRAIELKPDFSLAHYNLGLVMQETKRVDEAEAAYRKALIYNPDFTDARHNLGNLLRESKRLPEAEACYRQVLATQPKAANTHYNLGLLLRECERVDEAEAAFRTALTLWPDYADAHYNLGVLLHENRRLAEAEPCYRRALELNPGSFDVYFNLGNLLKRLDRFHEAQQIYHHALALKPDSHETHNNLGNTFKELGQFEQAAASLQRALDLVPEYAEAHLNRAFLRLQLGELGHAWADFEYRWKIDNKIPRRLYTQPSWLGDADLTGKKILLYGEQGLGDTLQFIRYAPLVAARGAIVYLEVPPAIVPLAETCAGVSAVFASGDTLPPFDYQCSLMSLPLVCQTELATIPATVPYLTSDSSRIARWGEKLGKKTLPRVGLVWAGNPRKHLPSAHMIDLQRSIHLHSLRPLLDIPGIAFYSLQLGDDAVSQLKDVPQVIDFMAEVRDFQDTAALMENLDLMISVDTSVAHLAGAIGKPFWLLNRFNTCWRWLMERSDSPWYPSARIFRQSSPGDWDSVIKQVNIALNAWLADQNTTYL